MDAYYAQVEMKRHGISESQPMCVLQWRSIVALNYKAKDLGVTRGMTVYDALTVCPTIRFVHVATLAERNGEE